MTPEDIKIPSASTSLKKEVEIKFPDPLPVIGYDEKIAQKIDRTFKMHNRLEPFMGLTLFENVFYLYLFNKYKMGCIPTDINRYGIGCQILITDDLNFHNKTLSQNRNLVSKLHDCIKKENKIIIVPIILEIILFSGQPTGHANLLVYRQNTNEIEHFEPHGRRFFGEDYRIVNDKLTKFLEEAILQLNEIFKREGRTPIVLIKAHNVCPRMGLQVLEEKSAFPKNPKEPGGYCSVWSMFFAELCLKNPEIPSRLIYEAIMKKGELYRNQPNYFKSVIRGYTCFINKKIYKYFGHIGLMSDDERIVANSKTITKTLKNMVAKMKKDGWPTDAYHVFHDRMMEIMEEQLNIDPDVDEELPKYGDEGPTGIKEIYQQSKLRRKIKKDTSSSDLEYSKVRSPKRVASKTRSKSRSISNPFANLEEDK
jgi:hypothetical protein